MDNAVVEKKKPRFAGWRDATGLVWAHRARLSLGLVLMLISRLAGLVLPASSKYLIDDVIGGRRPEMLLPIALATGAATLLQAATSFALSQVLGVAAQRAITEMRKSVEEHVARLPVNYFDSTQTGVLISRIMSDAEGVRNLVGTGLAQLTGGIVTGIFAFGILLYVNWRLTTITVIVLAAFGAGMAFALKRLRPLFRERGKIQAEVTGRLSQSLSGIRVVKAYTAEKREDLIFARGVHRLFRNIAKSVTGISAITAYSSVIIGIVGMIMILLGGRAVLDGSMTMGELVMYIFFTGLMALPLVEIASIGTQITEALAGLDRIREIKNVVREDSDDENRQPLTDLAGEVVFDDVSFEYRSGLPVLRNVSFSAGAGSTTALVGPSGSGKSTLIGLVMTFIQPSSGRVLVDGKDLSSIRLTDYRSKLGIVLQDNFLFDGTIADNIRFSKPDATRAEIETAARIAHCDEFVDSFPERFETVVGERGIKLSGGQRQRIAIARAILAEPRILILDEATSNLDSESEAQIQDGLRTLRKGRTTFVIAHRLSTIRSADQILVLDGGEITERGTHHELLAIGGRYKQLHDRQYQIETDRFVNPGEELTQVEY